MANFTINNDKKIVNKTEYRYSRSIVDDKKNTQVDNTIYHNGYLENSIFDYINSAFMWLSEFLSKRTVYSNGSYPLTNDDGVTNKSGDQEKFLRFMADEYLNPQAKEFIENSVKIISQLTEEEVSNIYKNNIVLTPIAYDYDTLLNNS